MIISGYNYYSKQMTLDFRVIFLVDCEMAKYLSNWMFNEMFFQPCVWFMYISLHYIRNLYFYHLSGIVPWMPGSYIWSFGFWSSALLIALLTAQKMKFSINDFFSKYDQIRSFLWIWSHFLKKSWIENFIFCAVILTAWKFCFAQNPNKHFGTSSPILPLLDFFLAYLTFSTNFFVFVSCLC